MAKQDEIAEVSVNGGGTFRDWKTVSCSFFYNQISITRLTVTEKVAKGGAFRSMQLVPGHRVAVKLAGRPALVGTVTTRQSAYDARNHGVEVIIKSLANETTISSVPLKGGQFKKQSLEGIANKVLKPTGVKFRIENGGKDALKEFLSEAVIPGETIHQFLGRLCGMRGLFLRDDSEGTLIAGRLGNDMAGADLREGVNVKVSNCIINNESAVGQFSTVGQQKGSDQVDGDAARKPAAFVDGEGTQGRYRLVVAEQTGDKDDMRIRADHESALLQGSLINATAIVQGWLHKDGDLWGTKVNKQIKFVSPMHVLDHMLGVSVVTMGQDDKNGTTTAIGLMTPGAMGLGAYASDLPGGNTQPAKPEEERT